MTDYDELIPEQLAAERVIEAMGREPKTQGELIRECEIGEVIPLDCFMQTALPLGRRIKVPVMGELSVVDFAAALSDIDKQPQFYAKVFERTAAGWKRLEDDR